MKQKISSDCKLGILGGGQLGKIAVRDHPEGYSRVGDIWKQPTAFEQKHGLPNCRSGYQFLK